MAMMSVQKYPSRFDNSPNYSPNDIFNQIVEENRKKREEEELAERQAALTAYNEEAKRRAQMGLPANSNPEHERQVSDRRERVDGILANHYLLVSQGSKSMKPIQRDASGWPVKGNTVSLRPGAGVNPGQSVYGFSSMMPSNAGRIYTIDQYGNKRYL